MAEEPKVCYDAPAEGKKHICVIGAGASGLTAIKELTAAGHKVTCFEQSPRIGGVYTKSYDSTLLTTSSLLTAFSDYSDGLENRPRFWSDEEYLWYLDGFAHKFGLYPKIQFRTRVEKAHRCEATGRWHLTLRREVYTWPHRSIFLLGRLHGPEVRAATKQVRGKEVMEGFYQACEAGGGFDKVKWRYDYEYLHHGTGERVWMRHEEPPAEVAVEHAFDALVVCTGTNNWASMPHFKGQESFKGKLIHAEDYRRPEMFTGKRVMIVGAGESGSDICNEVAHYASKVAIVVRGKHGHLIPRKQADGRVTDLNTNRVRYSNPYILGDWVGWANQHAKKFVAKCGGDGADKEEALVLQTIGKLNLEQGTSAFSKFGCKNEGFVTAIVTKGAELHREGFSLTPDGAKFDDGREFKCDVVIACTGYRNSFPLFLDPKHADEVFCPKLGLRYRELAEECVNPRLLYKQLLHPSCPDGSLAFLGFARPAFGSIPPTSEMQSRFLAMVLSGELVLPGPEELARRAKLDQDNWDYRFGYDAKRVKGLVDFQIYCDDLAEQMGSLPPLSSIFLTKPRLWWKIMFSSFTMHQYRLEGPYANPAVAEEVYLKQPVGDFLECSITAAFLVTAKVLSLVGFKDFRPNNF
mmetsp:Transcript_31644/g.71137  ORF Transcript_31644/g.71137 Transcript_31644/m.71137 type:complete len:635 (-) Transcript_31644:271-2175(-)